jgi:hypothetical protein
MPDLIWTSRCFNSRSLFGIASNALTQLASDPRMARSTARSGVIPAPRAGRGLSGPSPCHVVEPARASYFRLPGALRQQSPPLSAPSSGCSPTRLLGHVPAAPDRSAGIRRTANAVARSVSTDEHRHFRPPTSGETDDRFAGHFVPPQELVSCAGLIACIQLAQQCG